MSNLLKGLIAAALVLVAVTVMVTRPKVEKMQVRLYSANWCPSCFMFRPIYETVRAEYKDRVDFLVVDVDEHPQEAKARNVRFIPLVIVEHRGEELWRSDTEESYMAMSTVDGFKLVVESLLNIAEIDE